MADSILDLLGGAVGALVNGGRAFGDQAKWNMGAYGNAPMPAPYDGGPQYPAPDDANAYVRNNWPGDGRHLFHTTRPETFSTPYGFRLPPEGRRPEMGEMDPNYIQMLNLILRSARRD